LNERKNKGHNIEGGMDGILLTKRRLQQQQAVIAAE
jgi:hypothetical protein